MSRTRRERRSPEGDPPSRRELLKLLGRSDFPPSSLREMFRRLKIPKQQRMAFKRLIQELLSEGKLVRVGSTRYALVRDGDTVEGRIQRHADGFGFLVPDTGKE